MRRAVGWIVVGILLGVAGAAAEEAPADARLVEAQGALDEAKKLQETGRPSDAAPLYERAIALREAVLGRNHLDLAAPLLDLAILYRNLAAYERAEPLFERALAIREAVLGHEHPDVAAALHQLAGLHAFQGAPHRAEPLLKRALAIREAALGEAHPDVASSLQGLANIYNNQGFYGRAEPLFQRSLAIRESALGKDHLSLLPLLNNLAAFYVERGASERAEPLYLRALAIARKAGDKDHSYESTVLHNLALLYIRQGFHARAEPLLERVLAAREATYGKDHPDVARTLQALAFFYEAQGLYTRAQPLHQRALALFENSLGKDHPTFGDALLGYAGHHRARGRYAQAEPLYQRALASLEAALGPEHPRIAAVLNEIARLRLAQHRLAEALPLLTRAFTLSEQRLRVEMLDFSESRLESFLQQLRAEEERLYALLRAYPGDAGVRRLALTAVLLRKGRSVEEAAGISRTIYRSLGVEDRATFERLRVLRTQLAALALAGPGPRAPADYQQRLKDVTAQGDALAAELAQRSAPLRALAALPRPDEVVDRVAAALPPDGALVELVAYTHRPLVPKPGVPEAKLPSELRYVALVLFPSGRTGAVDLGPVAPIDRAASRLRDVLAARDATYQEAAQALYQRAFLPLQPLLGATRRLFLAPDGQLGLVPFAALHDGRHFLADTFDFTYLTSGKDLLPRPEDLPPARSVVVLADPDFGASPPSGGALAGRSPSPSLERFFSGPRASLADQPWAPLPGTRQEAEAIGRLLPGAELFLGAAATKERLLHLEAPGILHIATHGFFLEDPAATPAGARAVGHFGALGASGPASPLPDPLLRSGLVLAGAQSVPREAGAGGKHRLDEALVTALELAGLDLWGTELVVLSACDTGRGDIKLGQGVYGLRRAFVVAGAETVVTSLWKVNDESTRALMEGYYRNLLAGKGRALALREAMLALREENPHPHYWAPFIALGRDAPLRGIAPASPEEPGR